MTTLHFTYHGIDTILSLANTTKDQLHNKRSIHLKFYSEISDNTGGVFLKILAVSVAILIEK